MGNILALLLQLPLLAVEMIRHMRVEMKREHNVLVLGFDILNVQNFDYS
jgi:hypothetical protein